MPMPKDAFDPAIHENVIQSWRQHMNNMEKSLDLIENYLNQASEMTEICTSEWCQAAENVLDDMGNFLFSISEPRGASEEDSQKLKELKNRLHDLYAQYKSTAQQSAA